MIYLLLPLSLAQMGAGTSDTPHPTVVLTGARVLAADGGQFMEEQDVLIIGRRIVEVRSSREMTSQPDARRLDLSGLTLIPGLIDLHTHLLLHPYDETSWNDQVLTESLELRTIRAVPAMRGTLESGFTTIRDLGTEGAGFADVALREAVDTGIVTGPRIFACTRALVATGCYGPSGFDPRWTIPKGAQVADGPDGIRRAVREQIAAGADWIKIYADYRRRPGDAPTPTYSQAELNAAVEESKSAGLPVAAHAVTDEAVRRAVMAGVQTIEHAYGATEDVLIFMRERGVVLCPTLAASEAMARYSGWQEDQPDHPRIVQSRTMFKRALHSGVTIACGSDAGVFAHGGNARELELMVDYGMTPERALQAATLTAAKVLKRSHDLGRIEQGYIADIVAVRGNPLEDITVLRDPVMVIKEGHAVVDRR